MSMPIEIAVPLPVRRYVGAAERLLMTALSADTCVIIYCLIVAYWLRFYTPLARYGAHSDSALRDYAGYMVFGTVLMVLTLGYHRLYAKQTLLRHRHVSLLVLKSGVVWLAAFATLTLVFKFQPPLSRMFVVFAGTSVTLGLLIWRNTFHRLIRASPLAQGLKQRVLFVGWSEEAQRLADSFQADEACAYEVVGYVPLHRGYCEQAPPKNVTVFPPSPNLAHLFLQEHVEIAVLADVDCPRSEIAALTSLCEKEIVEFKIIPSYFEILVSGLHLETINGVPILGVTRLPLDKLPNVMLKRALDIIGAIVGLTLSIPLILVFGTLVYLESPGPIFYRQRRLGQRGMEFEIYKIRSMRLNAEENGRAGWTTANDARRLKIGAVIRKWNIDEIPQFWNVLKGEMSLVGPRPERPELIVNFKEEIPHYNARHNVKPGITGWAQTKGFRGDTDLTERIKCDIWYLENWNLFLDIQIMLMTFVKNENAA